MSVHSKKPRSAGLNVLVYDRALHPELFAADARRSRLYGNMDVTVQLLTGGGHLIAVTRRNATVTEVAGFGIKTTPEHGLIEKIPCKGDKQFDKQLAETFQYYLALNEEHITDALVDTSEAELLRIAAEQDGLSYTKRNELGAIEYMGVVVCQFHRRNMHIEAFHLLGEARVMIRSQSIFEPLK
ncbi:MAG: hypothetical protein WCJ97_08475 [Phycisphaerae bacterium]|jgi:hypothetical protein